MINKTRDGLNSTQYTSFRGNSTWFTPVKTLAYSNSKSKFELTTKKQSIDIINDSSNDYTSIAKTKHNEISRSNSSNVNHKENLLSVNKSFVNNEK